MAKKEDKKTKKPAKTPAKQVKKAAKVEKKAEKKVEKKAMKKVVEKKPEVKPETKSTPKVEEKKPARETQVIKKPTRETQVVKKPVTRETQTIKKPRETQTIKKHDTLMGQVLKPVKPKKVKPKEAKFEDKKDLDKLYVYFTIVNAGVADNVVSVFEDMGCSVSFIQNGIGTASEEVKKALHIQDSRKEVVISIIRESRLEDVEKELAAFFMASRRNKGVAFATRMDAIQGVRLYKFLTQTL